jgi:hypothetical protein
LWDEVGAETPGATLVPELNARNRMRGILTTFFTVMKKKIGAMMKIKAPGLNRHRDMWLISPDNPTVHCSGNARPMRGVIVELIVQVVLAVPLIIFDCLVVVLVFIRAATHSASGRATATRE